jgi:hypothetical protein
MSELFVGTSTIQAVAAKPFQLGLIMITVLVTLKVTRTLTPILADFLAIQERLDTLLDWAFSSPVWKRYPKIERAFRAVLSQSMAKATDQMLWTALVLPIVGATFGSYWLYVNLPLFWRWLEEHAPWVDGVVPYLVAVLGSMLVATGFWLREKHARTYGVIELGVAFVALVVAGGSSSFSAGLLPFASAIYVGVRGCDNIRRGIEKRQEEYRHRQERNEVKFV